MHRLRDDGAHARLERRQARARALGPLGPLGHAARHRARLHVAVLALLELVRVGALAGALRLLAHRALARLLARTARLRAAAPAAPVRHLAVAATVAASRAGGRVRLTICVMSLESEFLIFFFEF